MQLQRGFNSVYPFGRTTLDIRVLENRHSLLQMARKHMNIVLVESGILVYMRTRDVTL